MVDIKHVLPIIMAPTIGIYLITSLLQGNSGASYDALASSSLDPLMIMGVLIATVAAVVHSAITILRRLP